MLTSQYHKSQTSKSSDILKLLDGKYILQFRSGLPLDSIWTQEKNLLFVRQCNRYIAYE